MKIQGWRVYPESEYAMCSQETKSLAQVYIDYNLRFNGSGSPYTGFAEKGPLLERISAWLLQ
mgnify:CR=1 FL=1